MDKRVISQIVDLVSTGKQNNISDGDIAKELIAIGIPENKVINLIECVVAGFKSGVNAVVTGGMSAEGYTLGENPYFDLAFQKGKAAMRFTTPSWVLMKFLVPFLIGAIVIGAILWIIFR